MFQFKLLYMLVLWGAMLLLGSAPKEVNAQDDASVRQSQVVNSQIARSQIEQPKVNQPQVDLVEVVTQFESLYAKQWGKVAPCSQQLRGKIAACSPQLRNDSVAPYIRINPLSNGRVAVLSHGLSDSPFYLRDIADLFYQHGFTVVLPLLPGHGLADAATADKLMQDTTLDQQWENHITDVMGVAKLLGDRIVVGGFSTGAALTTHYTLKHPQDVSALVTFSGALALSDNAENLSRIWGIQWIARLIDGDYQTQGANPFKYPTVASFAGLELMQVIDRIRAKFEAGERVQVPLFSAHSQADTTTPIAGIENLIAHTDAVNTLFVIDQSYHVCHADVVVSAAMWPEFNMPKREEGAIDQCDTPKANPIFTQMTWVLSSFLQEHFAQ